MIASVSNLSCARVVCPFVCLFFSLSLSSLPQALVLAVVPRAGAPADPAVHDALRVRARVGRVLVAGAVVRRHGHAAHAAGAALARLRPSLRRVHAPSDVSSARARSLGGARSGGAAVPERSRESEPAPAADGVGRHHAGQRAFGARLHEARIQATEPSVLGPMDAASTAQLDAGQSARPSALGISRARAARIVFVRAGRSPTIVRKWFHQIRVINNYISVRSHDHKQSILIQSPAAG